MPEIASGFHQVIPNAIDQRPPGGIDDVAGYSHGGPFTGAVRAIDEHTGAGGGAAMAIDDAHFVIGELHPGDLRIAGDQGFPQGAVQGVDGAVPFGYS